MDQVIKIINGFTVLSQHEISFDIHLPQVDEFAGTRLRNNMGKIRRTFEFFITAESCWMTSGVFAISFR